MLRIENPYKGQMKLFDTWIPKEFTQLTGELAIKEERIYRKGRKKQNRSGEIVI